MNTEKQPAHPKPLLYIVQPAFSEPKQLIQKEFTSDVEQAPVERELHEKNMKEIRTAGETEEEEVIVEENEAAENPPVSAAADSRPPTIPPRALTGGLTPVKSFKAMTIKEKLYDLANRPQFYSCLFLTEKDTVIGKLHKLQDDRIIVVSNSGEWITIEKKQLADIRIYG
ncbi:CotO family spore coat protein [Siminovitchia sediminis]|uniref:CotO family spore coat protein n=1 Tax=Siminovitchia sediminis TaxID=1274353 RepID=A0ABW4KEX5_9BACI